MTGGSEVSVTSHDDAVDDGVTAGRRRRAAKWFVVVALAILVGLALWYVVFPYVATLLPENF